MSDPSPNRAFVNKLFHGGWGIPKSKGRRKEWNPKKNVSRRKRRHFGKVHRRKAWRLSAQHMSDFFKERLTETSFTHRIFPPANPGVTA